MSYAGKPLTRYFSCRYGVTLSVQASETHYCLPRDNFGPYISVELGYPSVTPQMPLRKYVEGNWCFECGRPKEPNYSDTVYGYVPVHLVRDFIAIHGGFATEEDERRFENLIAGKWPEKEEQCI